MSDDAISESAETEDEARRAVTVRATKRWGEYNFEVTTTNDPSYENPGSGDQQPILWTAVAMRNPDQRGISLATE